MILVNFDTINFGGYFVLATLTADEEWLVNGASFPSTLIITFEKTCSSQGIAWSRNTVLRRFATSAVFLYFQWGWCCVSEKIVSNVEWDVREFCGKCHWTTFIGYCVLFKKNNESFIKM